MATKVYDHGAGDATHGDQLFVSQLKSQIPFIEQFMRLGSTHGLSIAVVRGNRKVFQQGLGWADVGERIPATPSTIYPIASITKGFTAAICGKLVEMGKLSWDTPVKTYIPNFNPVNDSKISPNATVIDILSHRTGLLDQATLMAGPNGQPLFRDMETLLRAVNNLEASPGGFRKLWSYCPLPFALVTHLVETVSGLSFADLLEMYIFEPLGMRYSSLIEEPAKRKTVNNKDMIYATAYTSTEDGAIIDRQVPAEAYKFPFDSSMGIQSTVADMAVWSQAIMAAYNSQPCTETTSAVKQDDAQFLSTEIGTILNPWCPLPPNKGGNPAYCLGWFLHEGHFISDDIFDSNPGCGDFLNSESYSQPPQNIIFHSGTGHGFSSSIHMYPERGDAVIVLGNSSSCGNTVDSVSKLLTSLLSNQSIDIEKLQDGTRRYASLLTQNWRLVRDALLHEQAKQLPQREALPPLKMLVGNYTNKETKLMVSIEEYGGVENAPSEDKNAGFGVFIGAVIKFGNCTVADRAGLCLWQFCDNTLCFLPDEAQYQRWNLSYLSHWSQFLIHLSIGNKIAGEDELYRPVLGLWWQHTHDKDGIWFSSPTNS